MPSFERGLQLGTVQIASGQDVLVKGRQEKQAHHGGHVLWWFHNEMPSFFRAWDSQYTADFNLKSTGH